MATATKFFQTADSKTRTPDGYELLARAIIESVLTDYRAALRHYKRKPDDPAAQRDVAYYERWLRGDAFKLYSNNMDPEYFIEVLRGEFDIDSEHNEFGRKRWLAMVKHEEEIKAGREARRLEALRAAKQAEGNEGQEVSDGEDHSRECEDRLPD